MKGFGNLNVSGCALPTLVHSVPSVGFTPSVIEWVLLSSTLEVHDQLQTYSTAWTPAASEHRKNTELMK